MAHLKNSQYFQLLCSINLPVGHVRSHTIFGPDLFSRFDVYWLQTNTLIRKVYRNGTNSVFAVVKLVPGSDDGVSGTLYIRLVFCKGIYLYQAITLDCSLKLKILLQNGSDTNITTLFWFCFTF